MDHSLGRAIFHHTLPRPPHCHCGTPNDVLYHGLAIYKANSGTGPRKVKLKYNDISGCYKLLIKNALLRKYYKHYCYYMAVTIQHYQKLFQSYL